MKTTSNFFKNIYIPNDLKKFLVKESSHALRSLEAVAPSQKRNFSLRKLTILDRRLKRHHKDPCAS